VSHWTDRCKRALARIDEIRGLRPELEGLLAYYSALLEAGSELTSDFKPDFQALPGDACRQRAAEGRPLLEPGDVRLDAEMFDRLFERLVAITREHHSVFGEDLDFPCLPEDRDGWREELVAGLMRHGAVLENVSERAGGDAQLFAFLAQQALMPFMEANAWELRGLVDPSSWSHGRCPVCGGEALMARFEAEAGKRFLQCGLCLTEWTYKRVACVSCGSEDQDKLRFFTDEKDEAYRVDVCDGCKTYIKTADERKINGDVCLPVDHLSTIHLDLVAEQEGFHRLGGGVPPGN
jgi:FdhE protein